MSYAGGLPEVHTAMIQGVHVSVKVREVRCLAVAGVTAVMLAGCGSSGGSAGKSPDSASGGATVSAAGAAGSSGGVTSSAAFCTPLGDYARKFKNLSLGSSDLSAVKKQLPPLVDSGKQAANGAPSEIKGDVTALVGDISAINTWVQTKATEKDLSGENVPAGVAKPFTDLEKRLPTLASWYAKNCKGTFGS